MPSTNFITKTVTLRPGETRESAIKTLNQSFPKSFPNTGSGIQPTGKPIKPNFAKFTFVRGGPIGVQIDLNAPTSQIFISPERSAHRDQQDPSIRGRRLVTFGDPQIPVNRPKRISSPKRKSTRVTLTPIPLEQRKRIFANAQRKFLKDDIKLRAREMALRKRGTRDAIEDANALKRRRLNFKKFLQREKRDIRLASKVKSSKQDSIFDPFGSQV